jgi:hypothetical protein
MPQFRASSGITLLNPPVPPSLIWVVIRMDPPQKAPRIEAEGGFALSNALANPKDRI